MPSLTLKDIPPAVHQRLKRRAARSRRSLSQEAIACLEHAVMGEPVPVDELLATARRLRRGIRADLGVPLVTNDRQVLAAFPDRATSPGSFAGRAR